jgi:hypothetical protein
VLAVGVERDEAIVSTSHRVQHSRLDSAAVSEIAEMLGDDDAAAVERRDCVVIRSIVDDQHVAVRQIDAYAVDDGANCRGFVVRWNRDDRSAATVEHPVHEVVGGAAPSGSECCTIFMSRQA